MPALPAIPKFRLPGFVAHIGSQLPQWPHAVVVTAWLNSAARLNLLPADSLALLEGRTFLVQALDTGGEAAFTCRGGIFRPVPARSGSPDLVLRASLSAFLRLLARQEDPDTLFFNRELAVEGDTELSLVVKNMLDAVELPRLREILTLPRR